MSNMLDNIKNAVKFHPRKAILVVLFAISIVMQVTVGYAPPGGGGGPF